MSKIRQFHTLKNLVATAYLNYLCKGCNWLKLNGCPGYLKERDRVPFCQGFQDSMKYIKSQA